MTPKLDLRVSRRSVQQEAVDKLRDAILAGMFQPGNRLTEAKLCTLLGVSRPLLREALRSLQAEHLIEIVPNRGPQIPVLSWREAEEIYEVRALLEGEAAARCAATIKENGLAAVAEQLEAFRQAVADDDLSEQLVAAAEFYAVILRNCGNKVIEQLHGSLVARISFLRTRSMSLSGRANKGYEEMNAIFEAIRQHDPKQARKLAQAHVTNAREAAKLAFVEDSLDLKPS